MSSRGLLAGTEYKTTLYKRQVPKEGKEEEGGKSSLEEVLALPAHKSTLKSVQWRPVVDLDDLEEEGEEEAAALKAAEFLTLEAEHLAVYKVAPGKAGTPEVSANFSGVRPLMLSNPLQPTFELNFRLSERPNCVGWDPHYSNRLLVGIDSSVKLYDARDSE